ncbi:response regulator transcription factor [Nocardioides exalbidus]|uniref:response regulator transcription factor n=1 Tax=Nocardioides exalbidus TaxID=402596 RepID=UPI001587B7BC|nr:response regulator transcription factor [Nocardioides exalbidus]
MGHLLALVLSSGGLDAVHVTSGDEALARALRHPVDLVLVDSDPPDLVGHDVCSGLRDHGFAGGIVILSDHVDEMAVVTGLDLGADDYVSRPCSVAELLSRVRAVLRRLDRVARSGAANGPAALHVDLDGHAIRWGDVVITTSGREHELLAALLAHRGRVVTREWLMDAIWGPEWSGSPMVLNAAVNRLRVRLAAAGASDAIENVRGVGFRLGPADGSRGEDSLHTSNAASRA